MRSSATSPPSAEPRLSAGVVPQNRMRRKELDGLANNLAVMACSEQRLFNDLETLARLPDGTLVLDLKAGSAKHSAGNPAIEFAKDIASWLEAQLNSRGFESSRLETAEALVAINTQDPPTHRDTLISFRFKAKVSLRAEGHEYTGEAQNHFWFNRTGAQQGAPGDGPRPAGSARA